MSEAQTETTQVRPQEAAAEAAGSGRHRGPAAATEEARDTAHGRHRRDHQVQTF
ncbi:hypothetical protein [Streptomyces noursei]|uniref:hypothetical protein n=1 Tax=Streptomyces noursei TaxID=1971 RepID=UPI001679B7FD|nr:hypothetical protein [Streptomyces noursei]MCZ1015463.1 hypothetical protein [Streptomyces noursei]GGX17704.1 hypothetical protein GCM10010341_43980 [Streptomyces noursei]